MIRTVLVLTACLVWLAGCANSPGSKSLFGSDDVTGSISQPGAPSEVASLLGSDPNDDLSLGKKQFRASNYGLAEQHFRKAVELHPKDAEAWVGLAAAYDRLRRFDLADRAYKEALTLIGPTPEVLNNQGFSYVLRGDYRRAEAILRKAQAGDPHNPYILNNINLLHRAMLKHKGVK